MGTVKRLAWIGCGALAATLAATVTVACSGPAEARNGPGPVTVPLRDPISIPLRGAEAVSGCIPGTTIRLTVTDDGRDSDGSSSMVQDPTCAEAR